MHHVGENWFKISGAEFLSNQTNTENGALSDFVIVVLSVANDVFVELHECWSRKELRQVLDSVNDQINSIFYIDISGVAQAGLNMMYVEVLEQRHRLLLVRHEHLSKEISNLQLELVFVLVLHCLLLFDNLLVDFLLLVNVQYEILSSLLGLLKLLLNFEQELLKLFHRENLSSVLQQLLNEVAIFSFDT